MRMKQANKRWIDAAWQSCAVFCALLALVPQASAAPRSASFVFDVNTGRVLHAKNAEQSVYPASLVKMMTLYLTFEALSQGKLRMHSRIMFSAAAARRPASKLGLKRGQSLTVKEAIDALIVKSANDVATAIAERLAGSEARFATLMTRKARKLGMRTTVFRNASGLPNRQQRTTAREIATLALRLYDHYPQYYRLFRQKSFRFQGRSYLTHNGLLKRFSGTDGIKTGYTRASGFNVVTSVRRNRRHLIGVVFGGRSARARDAKMRRLLRAKLLLASSERTRRPSRLRRRPQLLSRRRSRPRVVASAPVAPASPPIRIARVRRVDVRTGRGNTGRHSGVRRQREPRQLPDIKQGGRRQRDFLSAGRHAKPTPIRLHHSSAALGRAPSTLQAQAERLTALYHAVAFAPRPKAVYRTHREANGQPRRRDIPSVRNRELGRTLGSASAAREFQIQVGAYRSAIEARQRLASVRSRLARMLKDARPMAIGVRHQNRTIYRARFAGFDAHSASQVCNKMRYWQIDCYVVRSK